MLCPTCETGVLRTYFINGKSYRVCDEPGCFCWFCQSSFGEGGSGFILHVYMTREAMDTFPSEADRERFLAGLPLPEGATEKPPLSLDERILRFIRRETGNPSSEIRASHDGSWEMCIREGGFQIRFSGQTKELVARLYWNREFQKVVRAYERVMGFWGWILPGRTSIIQRYRRWEAWDRNNLSENGSRS